MAAVAALAYGLVAYVVFLGSFCYAIGFVGNFLVPKSIDSGAAGTPSVAALVDVMLLALFAVQHSVMARPAFKKWWTRRVPGPIERSTYVLLASLVLILLYWQWRPIPEPVWTVESPLIVAVLTAVFWLGWGITLVSSFLINHFELFGLTQVAGPLAKLESSDPVFATPLFYRWTRHPLYLGFLMAFWATPSMTAGHLLFAMAMTGYVLIGIFFEERDLIALFGDRYRRYRREVSMLVPRRRRNVVEGPAGSEIKRS